MSTHDDSDDEQRPEIFSYWNTIRRQPEWKCLVITLLIYGCLCTIAWCQIAEVNGEVLDLAKYPIFSLKKSSPCDEGYVYVPLAFLVTLYVVYLIECWHCTLKYDMRSRIQVSDAQNLFDAMREACPIVWWKAICYHYVRRTRQVTRYRNGDAYTTIQVYYERVNSHTSGSSFDYSDCGVRDITKRLIDLDKFPVTRLAFSKTFAFANQRAALDFEQQRMHFFHEYESNDDYMEMREGLDLLNTRFDESAIAYSDPLPWYASQRAYWLASIVLLSWPLRLVLAANTAHADLRVMKLFGTNYTDLTLSPTSACDAQMEWNITSNVALVPSYSQALLFEPRPQQQRCDSAAMRHSWSVDSSRRHLPSSGTCLSLGETAFYLAAPLAGNDVGRKQTSGGNDSPPAYDVAIRVCRPLAVVASATVSDLAQFLDARDNETAL